MPNFARPWCRNHMTHRDSWGIIGKIISVAFIWYLVVLNVTASLVTIASLKSGLILSALKMLISVLSNKAVLGVCEYLQRCECFQSSECVGGHFSDFVVAQISAIEIKRTSSREQLYYSVLFHHMNRHK